MTLVNKAKKIVGKVKTVLKSEKLYYSIAALICLCNAIFIFDNAIWGDEGYSAILVRKCIGEILVGTAADVHPPLYYLILKIAVSIFGESVLVLHITSYLFFVGTCVLIMTFIRKKFGLISAYLAILFVGWTDFGFVYSVEIRMYSMALFFITLTFCMAYEVIENGRMNNWICLAVFALLAGYTHYFALLAVAFMVFGVFIICMVKRQNDIWKKIGIASAICVVGYLPWLMAMITTVERTMEDFWLQVIPTFAECADVFLGAMSYSHKLLWILWGLLLAYICVNLWDILRNSCFLKEKIHIKGKMDIGIQMVTLGIWTYFCTAIIGIAVSTYIRPILLVRYLFPMIVLGAISLGTLIQYFASKKKIRWLILLAAMVLLLQIGKSGIDVYRKHFEEFCDRRKKTEVSLAEIKCYTEQGHIVLSNINHFDWTVLKYYYPNNFMHYNTLDEGKINTAVILMGQKLSDKEKIEFEGDKYTLAFINQGQIDNTEYYLYHLEKK